ncbi:putative disease resistance protein RGA3 [Coffea arabica]|uniref:Disease resistance protein RGA3 n=1 Tax=Coffea arabica TaxID=13443 RepID=A0A6P6WT79_COFAR
MEATLVSFIKVLGEKAISIASEEFCHLVGLKKGMQLLKESLSMIQAVLHDAERRQVGEEAVKLWLEKLENVAFDADDVLDEFNYDVLRQKVQMQNQMKHKVCFFFSILSPVPCKHVKLAKKIHDMNVKLKSINEDAKNFGFLSQIGANATASLPFPSRFIMLNRETDSTNSCSTFIGRDNDIANILEKLTAKSDEIVSVIPIVGMGGIGKTALAKRIFNHHKTQNQFDEKIWVCVSENFNVNRLFGLVLESLGQKTGKESREARTRKLQEKLEGKTYVMVLDDVWNENLGMWDDFMGSLKGINTTTGNFILVTTRKHQVASIMATSSSHCSLGELSDDECWLIFKEKAIGRHEVLEESRAIGLEIAQICQGLPLVACTVGGMLRNKRREEWISALKRGLQGLTENENNVMHILKLSFDNLPCPALKRCFAYSSIFSKDSVMERDQLIQLWMAEGFLQTHSRSMDMEEIGNMFFNILLQNSLFQDVEWDEYDRILSCKMHDLVHDLAQSMQNSQRDEDDIHPIRHLALENCGEETPSILNKRFRYIRSLFSVYDISEDVSYFISLRVLNLSSTDLTLLPKSISKLFRLRYLDLSDTPIEGLPNSICKLYNLQTLRARDCYGLREFPMKFKNLISLRHFDYFTDDSCSSRMPFELGKLACLRKLPFFNVGEIKGWKIEELRNLKNLTGRLEIRNLELVNCKKEAECANLLEKSNIHELTFAWCEDQIDTNRAIGVLEGLKPHPNLKGLILKNFMGNQLASWISDLRNLVKLEVRNCRRCKEIPALGHLPFLQYLELAGLDNITCIGPSFYGFDNSDASSSNHSSGQAVTRLFPALKYLILSDIENLKHWMELSVEIIPTDRVVVFPILEVLDIHRCPQLTTVPTQFPSLKNLAISYINHGLPVVTKICSKVITLTHLLLHGVQGLTCLPDWLLLNNANLTKLTLCDCLDLKHLVSDSQDCSIDHQTHNLNGIGSLETLYIFRCSQLKSVQIPSRLLGSLQNIVISECHGLINLSSEIMKSSASLDHFEVSNCSNLNSFPGDLELTPSLSYLWLSHCVQLTNMPNGICCLTSLRHLTIGAFSDTMEFSSFRDAFSGFKHLSSSLLRLHLYGQPHWESLPDQLQHLSALEELKLYDFGVKFLPDWFGKLLSLEKLHLRACSILQHFPPQIEMRRLTKLSELYIIDCPLLTQRCYPRSDSNPEWCKISHISGILIPGFRTDGKYS